MKAPRHHSRRLTKSQLRARYAPVRALAKKLQAKGLISPRANLSRAKPSLAVRKKALSLEGIFTGHQQAVEVTDVMASRFRKSGRRVIGRKVIFDKNPGQNVKKAKGEIVIEEPGQQGAFETVILPVSIKNLQAFIDWIETDPERLDAMMPPGTFFAFTYYGKNSREIGDARWLTDYLKRYADTGGKGFQHFVLVRVMHGSEWKSEPARKRTRARSLRDGRRQTARSAEYRKRYDYNRQSEILRSRENRRRAKEQRNSPKG